MMMSSRRLREGAGERGRDQAGAEAATDVLEAAPDQHVWSALSADIHRFGRHFGERKERRGKKNDDAPFRLRAGLM